MKDGFALKGKFLGINSEQWSSGGRSGVNNRAGIAREYQDEFGQTVADVTRVDLSPEFMSRLQQMQLQGKTVVLSGLIVRAKAGGKSGAWLSLYAPKDAMIEPVSPVKTAVA